MMIIWKVKLDQVRAFDKAEFTFLPGMNLVVGLNGVGKSTLLDALRNGLHKVMPELTAYRSSQNVVFTKDDIQIGKSLLGMELHATYKSYPFTLLMSKYRNRSMVIREGTEEEQEEQTPDTVDFVPAMSKILSVKRNGSVEPICLYFSTRRSYAIDQKPQVVDTGQAAAYNLSLSENRPLNLREIADWIWAQQSLREGDHMATARIEAVQSAIDSFFHEIGTVYISNEDTGNRLMVTKHGKAIYAKFLSDGERSLLSMAVEISRRLAIANPGLQDPIRDGTGIVLIDELDLHLHPKWQRTVVKQLTETFPKLQFIATTHSPQLIGEVPAERITVIGDTVYRPEHTFGMDSSRILEEVMDVSERNVEVNDILTKLFRQIDEEELAGAKATLQQLVELVGEQDGEVLRARTLIHFLED